MNYLLLPDFLGMCVLVLVLFMARDGRTASDKPLWNAGLLLILLEGAARIVYSIPGPLFLTRASHVVMMDASMLAGITFLLSASPALQRMPRRGLFVWINAVPVLALLTVYGLDNRTPAVYFALIGVGVADGLLSCTLLKRAWRYYGAVLGLWTLLLVCVLDGQFRTAVSVSLSFVYLLCALSFSRSMPTESRGKIAVVGGFSIWAMCFFAYPWIADAHTGWLAFSNQVRYMQKFIITVGLLLVSLERQLRSNEWLALHDELTDLPNRRLFDDRLQHALAIADRDGHRVALFNLDLDGFKPINDSLGHNAGDVLLRAVAQNLLDATRKSDTLARLGGDEFSLVVVDLGEDPAGFADHPILLPQTERIFAKMLRAVEMPVPLGPAHGNYVVQVSASVGVAIFPDDGREAHTLMHLADQRMYTQKAEREQHRRLTGSSTPLLYSESD